MWPVEPLVSDWPLRSSVPPARTIVAALGDGAAVTRILPPAPTTIVPAEVLLGAVANQSVPAPVWMVLLLMTAATTLPTPSSVPLLVIVTPPARFAPLEPSAITPALVKLGVCSVPVGRSIMPL